MKNEKEARKKEREAAKSKQNKKPMKNQSRQQKAVCFTEEEERLFQHRYENGYNLKHDQHFNEWISLNYPHSKSVDSSEDVSKSVDTSEEVSVVQKSQTKRQTQKKTG